ncbi:MAG: hypothetical protein WAO24_05950 [Peptococcia bacterium]
MKISIKFAKLVRIVTVAPLIAFGLLSITYGIRPELFQGLKNYLSAVIFLTVLPLTAYPLQPFIPKFRDKGREGQRNLAIVMAIIGYVCGMVYVLIARVPRAVLLIYLTYFFSGLGILLFNRVLKIRASGHSGGVVGPTALLVLFVGLEAIFYCLALILLVFWASLKTKRHSLSQLLWGSMIPLVALFLAILCVGKY